MKDPRTINIPSGLSTDASVFRINRETGVSRPEVIGWLYGLFDYVARNGRCGLIEGYSIPDLVLCIGADEAFWRAVCKTRWLKEEPEGMRVFGCPTKLRRHRDGVVYFIGAKGSGRVKIGFCGSSIELRLSGIQTGSSELLSVLATIPGSMSTEREMHRRFKHLRIGGEWFRVDDELSEFIREAAGANK